MIKIDRLVTNKCSQEYLLEVFSFGDAILNNNVFKLECIRIRVGIENKYELISKLGMCVGVFYVTSF